MLLREALKLVIKEESDPVSIARIINNKLENLNDYSKINIETILNTLANEAKNKNGILLGNGKFINPNDQEKLNNYINNIRIHLNIRNEKALMAINNILNTLKNKIIEMYNTTHRS